ncbi:polyketide synthase [Streptomyces griseofuscus]|uniref:beta-ketoacyl [acyl carrier protein] synthase domain-containing protein n=1 Tax=Streptomyces griseofuscus TaxID=146922 RepID=UPI000F64816D|nr:polyketide synthase [Streptomyces griseofuscus]RRQ72618.1 polyketide synthase [Streptomyces griseofuscus]
MLAGGRDVVREVPEERWSQEEVFGLPADVAARLKWGAFLDEDVYAYDPAFFGINAHEAAWVDPHHRLLCETFWEAAEHAGVPPRSLSGKPVGTYFGVYNKEYLLRAQRPLEEIDAYAMNASIHSMAAGRIAYLLDLRGPQMTLEAGCSSGLVALHAACQGLRDKESDLAFAGACVLILGPEESVPPARWSFFSPTGRCRAFDAGADGYVRGEGCVVLALKRLDDAVRDGDRILGVIRGSALNQNGGRSTRLTAPSTDAQIEVCRRALAAAGVDPGDVGLVEAHGTGTEVGDPLEFRALAEVYGSGPGVCALGSVKTNIGHTEPVAGLAGVLKTLLSVQRVPAGGPRVPGGAQAALCARCASGGDGSGRGVGLMGGSCAQPACGGWTGADGVGIGVRGVAQLSGARPESGAGGDGGGGRGCRVAGRGGAGRAGRAKARARPGRPARLRCGACGHVAVCLARPSAAAVGDRLPRGR